MYFILLETFISYLRNTTQGLKLGLLPCKWVLYCVTHQGSPYKTSVQFSSVAQSCPTLCGPMNRSTPGLPVHHQLPESTQTHVHRVGDTIQPSVIPFSSCLQSFPASASFPMSQFFASSGQSIGVSASASVLPMNIQD